MNPEEGTLPAQILDRFGISVLVKGEKDPDLRVKILQTRLAYENDPGNFLKKFAPREKELREIIQNARYLLPRVKISSKLKELIGHLAAESSVAGNRAEIYLFEASRAHAAFRGKEEVKLEDLEAVREMVLRHRRRFQKPGKKKKSFSKGNEEKKRKKGLQKGPLRSYPRTF